MKVTEPKQSIYGQPLVREWAEAQYEEARKAVIELGPEVEHNKKLARITDLVTIGCLVVMILLPHPRDLVFLGASILFMLMHAIIEIRGIGAAAELNAARWQMETMKVALRLAETIGFQMVDDYRRELMEATK